MTGVRNIILRLQQEVIDLESKLTPADQTPPANCRNRLKAEGKPFPKSGCSACYMGGMHGCPHDGTLRALLRDRQSAKARSAAGVEVVVQEAPPMPDDLNSVEKQLAEAKEIIAWFIENDETNTGGEWDEINAFWIAGLKRAKKFMGMEIEESADDAQQQGGTNEQDS